MIDDNRRKHFSDIPKLATMYHDNVELLLSMFGNVLITLCHSFEFHRSIHIWEIAKLTNILFYLFHIINRSVRFWQPMILKHNLCDFAIVQHPNSAIWFVQYFHQVFAANFWSENVNLIQQSLFKSIVQNVQQLRKNTHDWRAKCAFSLQVSLSASLWYNRAPMPSINGVSVMPGQTKMNLMPQTL